MYGRACMRRRLCYLAANLVWVHRRPLCSMVVVYDVVAFQKEALCSMVVDVDDVVAFQKEALCSMVVDVMAFPKEALCRMAVDNDVVVVAFEEALCGSADVDDGVLGWRRYAEWPL